jgi:hypothetical protein
MHNPTPSSALTIAVNISFTTSALEAIAALCALHPFLQVYLLSLDAGVVRHTAYGVHTHTTHTCITHENADSRKEKQRVVG